MKADTTANADLTAQLETLGQALLAGSLPAGPRWPDERTQLNYTGASGENLMKRTTDFAKILAANVPALLGRNWRGLDYGVGWGRIASVMTHFGDAMALDCVDAWAKSLELARACGLRNRMMETPALLGPTELGEGAYDFIYSYSIFTHLPKNLFINNLEVLFRALKPGGRLVFTVREPKFMEFLTRSGKVNPVEDRLAEDGYWFGNAQSADYGDTITSDAWLRTHVGHLGEITPLGVAGSEPFQSILMLTKPA
jgi:SAM-dependent methyltransferase